MSEITLLYVHSEAIGYGRMGVKLAEAIENLGVDLYDDLGDPADTATDSQTLPHGHRRHKRTHAVCWVSVPTHARGWWEGQHRSIFTMWEATYLPELFRENLHEFELVIVPSLHNVELFSQYHDNVKFVPLGIDPKDWYYIPRTPLENEFRFLIGGTGKRKGTDIAFRAFQKVFGRWYEGGEYSGPMPMPRLVMKNPRSEPFHAAFVDMVIGRISNEEEIDLYSQAHVYVQPSRGEGFGLQPMQAMAQGMPTILTNAHGHESFAHLGIPIGYSMSDSDYFIYGHAGKWWEPDLDELCEAMWDCYTNYEPQRKKAEESARIIHTDWTWENTARQFIDLYGGTLDIPGPSPEALWNPTTTRRYHVRVQRPVTCEINDLAYQFLPGKDYWEAADVKRILFEADNLDPACIYFDGFSDLDKGLTDAQIARLGETSAAHAYCHACGQRMNTLPTKADDILAGIIP